MKRRKLTRTVGAILLITLVGPIILFEVTYKSDVVTEGEGYGFKIGLSKPEAYAEIIKLHKINNKITIFSIYGKKAGDFAHAEPKPELFHLFSTGHVWYVEFNTPLLANNGVRLHFIDGVVSKIYRHRQLLELP